jgi:hypothetical protein
VGVKPACGPARLRVGAGDSQVNIGDCDEESLAVSGSNGVIRFDGD